MCLVGRLTYLGQQKLQTEPNDSPQCMCFSLPHKPDYKSQVKDESGPKFMWLCTY